MNDINFSSNFPEWAKPQQLDVTFVDMSDANLSYGIKVPADIDHTFSLDWWIEVRGEKFYNTTLKPEGYKDDQSLMYNYTLVFDSERKDLKKYIWVDIDKLSGVPLIKSYANVFKLDLTEFVGKLNDNLNFYGLSSRWEVRIDPSLAISTEKKLVNADNAFIWDVLQQTTEIYGDVARWFIEAEGDKLIIKVGYPAVEINHIFQYGGDTPEGNGGLVKIERTLSSEKLTTVLAGRGGERNIPERYFEPAGDNYPADPDQNIYTASLNLKNLMPKCFRDYNRGWNSKIVKEGESEAYKQGVSDTTYRPIEWVKSEDGIATYGEIWDKLEPKEEIYATIQAIDADTARAAGVITTATGRLDEVIAFGNITGDEDKEGTFDIWVPDIGFDLRSPEYWAKEEMTVSFSSGWLAQSESYEFKVRGSKTPEAYVFPDTSKVSPSWQRSAWRITLIKSDAELDATGLMIPNSNPATQPIAGDYFFFTNITLPHSYVLIAEKRQEDYLLAAIKEIDHEIPVYSLKPDRIFCATFTEQDKLKTGAIVRIANTHLIDSIYESVHIQSITLKYDFKNRILPDWEMVVTDKISAALNAVQRVSADVSTLSQTQITEANVVAKVAAVGDKRWLRKDGVADVSNSPTKFSREVTSTNYTGAGFEKAGWAVIPHPDFPNESLGVFDHINVRKTLNIYEIIANQIKYMGGKMIFSATAMTISNVVDGGSYWKLFFDTKEGQIKNLWNVGDMVLCQEFDALNTQIKYYRLKVTRANADDDYIHVSKGLGNIPSIEDFIIQHGHDTDKQRQAVLVIDTIGGARFTSLQGLTDTNAVGSVVAEMGWIDGKPQFFVGDVNKSYIKYDGALQILNILANVIFKSPSGENTTVEQWAANTQQDINNANTNAANAKIITDNYTSIQGGLILTTKEELGIYEDGIFKPKLVLDGSVAEPKDSLLTIGDNPLTQTKYLLDGTVSMFGGKLGIDDNGDTFGNFATIYIGGINAIDFFNNFDTYFDVTDKEWLKIKKKTHVNGVISSDQGVVMFGTEGGTSGGGGNGTFYHDLLENRNRANQHTIASITDLQSILDGKVANTDYRLTDARPANGGNATTVGGYSSSHLWRTDNFDPNAGEKQFFVENTGGYGYIKSVEKTYNTSALLFGSNYGHNVRKDCFYIYNGNLHCISNLFVQDQPVYHVGNFDPATKLNITDPIRRLTPHGFNINEYDVVSRFNVKLDGRFRLQIEGILPDSAVYTDRLSVGYSDYSNRSDGTNRLWASEPQYKDVYSAYLSYNGNKSLWMLRVSPASPSDIEVTHSLYTEELYAPDRGMGYLRIGTSQGLITGHIGYYPTIKTSYDAVYFDCGGVYCGGIGKPKREGALKLYDAANKGIEFYHNNGTPATVYCGTVLSAGTVVMYSTT